MYIIAAFRSRNSSMKLYDTLKANGIKADVINTPKEAYIGCGLSVRFDDYNLEKIRYFVMRADLPSFAGYFSVSEFDGRKVIKKL